MADDPSDYQHDRRGAGERRTAQRATPERRQMVGLRLTLSGSVDNVEDWLERNCSGKFNLILAGMSDDLDSKIIEIMFEDKTDREKFKAVAGRF